MLRPYRLEDLCFHTGDLDAVKQKLRVKQPKIEARSPMLGRQQVHDIVIAPGCLGEHRQRCGHDQDMEQPPAPQHWRCLKITFQYHRFSGLKAKQKAEEKKKSKEAEKKDKKKKQSNEAGEDADDWVWDLEGQTWAEMDLTAPPDEEWWGSNSGF